MSLADIREKGTLKSPRIVLYGGAGVGKTTWAATTKNPIFILTEDGMGKVEAPHFPLATSFDKVIENLKTLLNEDHNYSTVVIDSIDWLEPLIWNKACEDNNWRSIEQPGYGKGYVEVLRYFREYIDILNQLRDQKNMMVLQIAHSHIIKFESPEIEAFDRFTLKLHRKASDLILEHSDCCFFANFKLGTAQVQGKGGKMTTKAVQGERVLYTIERPAFLAKNRYGLEAELKFDAWDTVREGIIKK